MQSVEVFSSKLSPAARFSLFADSDKRPSDPLPPALLEGGSYEIYQNVCSHS